MKRKLFLGAMAIISTISLFGCKANTVQTTENVTTTPAETTEATTVSKEQGTVEGDTAATISDTLGNKDATGSLDGTDSDLILSFETIGPAEEEYQETIKTADDMLAKGIITEEIYTSMLEDAKYTYESRIAELREMLRLDDLKLDYMVQIVDFDGECFTFSVRATDGKVKDLYEKIKEKIANYQESADDYVGYIDVYDMQDKVCIYYDTGNVEDGVAAVHGLLYAINEVPGVQSVVINEI